jgi:cation diffusion facilitator CzcD-associated flavoprotein CzcO
VNHEQQTGRPGIPVVGGGIGGMVTAIASSQEGFTVDVEHSSCWDEWSRTMVGKQDGAMPIGAPINIWGLH